MKRRLPSTILSLALTAAFLPAALAEDVVLLRGCSADGGPTTDHKVAREDLESVPPWEPNPGAALPLSRDRALEAARKAAIAAGHATVATDEETSVTLQTVNRFEKDLLQRLPKKACRWFYLVELKPAGKEPFRCVVTMNGTVAHRGDSGE